MLRVIQQIEYIGGILVSVADDVVGHPDQFPLDEFLGNESPMVFNVGGGGYFIGQFYQVVRSADGFQMGRFFQFLGNRKQVDGLRALKQAQHRLVDQLVSIQVKTIRL